MSSAKSSHNNIVSRYLWYKEHIFLYINNMKGFIANDGLVDSIKFLMSDFTYKNRFTVRSLLLSF